MQPSLFDFEPEEHGRARHTDPETSHQAAKEVDAGGIAGQVLEVLRLRGAKTGWEVHLITGIALNTVTPRFAQLRRKGLIAWSGEFRLGPTGKKQRVWKAV